MTTTSITSTFSAPWPSSSLYFDEKKEATEKNLYKKRGLSDSELRRNERMNAQPGRFRRSTESQPEAKKTDTSISTSTTPSQDSQKENNIL